MVGSLKNQENEQEFLQSFNDDQDEGFIGSKPDENLSERERFRKFAKQKEEVESTSDFFKRNVSQHAARALETGAGFLGNFKKAIMQTRDFLEESSPLNEKLSNLEEKAIGKPSVESLEHRFMNPITSSELRQEVTPNISEKLGLDKNYLEPRGKLEEASGELTQDLVSMFMPGTSQLRMLVRVGAPIAGNLTKQGLKYLGVEDKTAEQAKLGMMLATTIAGQSNPAQFAQQRIAQAREMVPANTTVAAAPLGNLLRPLYDRLTRGFRVPSKAQSMQGINDLANQIDQNGRISLRSLMDARNDVNEWIAEAGGFDVPTTVRDRTIANLNDLKRQIIDTVDTNLAARFPEAGELYQTGYEAAAVTHQSNAISNFIEKYFGRKVSSAAAKVLFPGLAGGAAILPKTAAVGAAALPIYKTGQVLYRIGNSPTLAVYYSDVLRNAAQGNVAAMVKSMDKLDKELYKEEQKEEKKSSKEKESLEHFKSRFSGKG